MNGQSFRVLNSLYLENVEPCLIEYFQLLHNLNHMLNLVMVLIEKENENSY